MRIAVLVLVLFGFAGSGVAQEVAPEEPFTVEFYYKVKWGHYGEWLDLYKKNHWPLLDEARTRGDILGPSDYFQGFDTVGAGRRI